MVIHVARFRFAGEDRWGVICDDQLLIIQTRYDTTGQFIAEGTELARSLFKSRKGERVPLSSAELLSPITKPCRVICQGKNYLDHLLDTGIKPEDKPYNMFFNKSSASIIGPNSDVVKPKHVRLLDYEIELGLVISKSLTQKIQFDRENIHSHVGGLVIGNDVSARDVQLPQSQFFKGKSYRTFCPVGPFIALIEVEDTHYLSELNLELRVNGQIRQKASTSSMIYKPDETLTELSEFSDLDPGDLILTGTPKGTALKRSTGFSSWISRLLPQSKYWKKFIAEQLKSSKYLKPGDLIEASIKSPDGKIDLGTLRNRVVEQG